MGPSWLDGWSPVGLWGGKRGLCGRVWLSDSLTGGGSFSHGGGGVKAGGGHSRLVWMCEVYVRIIDRIARVTVAYGSSLDQFRYYTTKLLLARSLLTYLRYRWEVDGLGHRSGER